MKKFCVLLFFVTACNTATNTKTTEATVIDTSYAAVVSITTSTPTTSIDYKTLIQDNWTDGSDENATIRVMADSILYISHMDKYKYRLQNDSITVYFTDNKFTGKLIFKDDSMLWLTKTDTTKFWKFN